MQRRRFSPSFTVASEQLEYRQLLTKLPAGLMINTLSSNFSNPTTFVSDHQSLIFVGDINGTIQAVSTEDGHVHTLGKLDAENVDARGLYGLALDPNFAQNQTMYAFYYALTPAGGREARVSKILVSTPEAMTDHTPPSLTETVIFRVPISNSPRMHHGGAFEIDKNGYLFFAIGDLEEP